MSTPLSVAGALALPALAGAQLVAGRAGQDRVVRWVHAVGVPDAYKWLHGGELVLATIINLPDGAAAQRGYIRALAERGVAGLVLAVGNTLAQVPPHLCAEADAHSLPLLSIPYEVPFVDVARAVNERIATQHYKDALHIHERLSRLVLDGRGLDALAETLAGLIRQSVSIETAAFEALASHNVAEVDEARRFTMQHKRTHPALVAALAEAGVLRRLREERTPQHLPPMPHVGLEKDRILAPIVVQGVIYGYIWIIADDGPLSDLHEMALRAGATVAALMLLHAETVHNAEANLRGRLLGQLVGGAAGPPAPLQDAALRYGVALGRPYTLLLLEPPTPDGAPPARLAQRLVSVAQARGLAALVGTYEERVLALAAPAAAEALAGLFLEAAGTALWASLSAAGQGVAGVQGAFAQARDVLTVAQRLQLAQPGKLVRASDLGYLLALFQAGPRALDANPYVAALRTLAADPGPDLLHTLEIYLDSGANGVAAATTLHLHRSTLNYRLGRIAAELDAHVAALGAPQVASLDDPAARTQWHMALKLLRLFG